MDGCQGTTGLFRLLLAEAPKNGIIVRGKRAEPITHQVFLEMLREFPELKTDLERFSDLLHLQMTSFATRTQQAIDGEDSATLKRCFDLADDLLRNGDHEVKNAVYVSYLEHLNFSDSKRKRGWTKRQWALKQMPPALRKGLDDINQYLGELFRKP